MTMSISGGSAFIGHYPFVLLPSAARHLFLCATTLNTPCSAIFARAKSKAEHNKYRGPTPKKDLVQEWISKNDNVIRTSPIYVGCLSLAAVLLNRTVSGISPIADASSSQSRADVLTLALAVTIVLTGLVWISIRPKYFPPVKLQGVECKRVEVTLPAKAAAELYWVRESLANITCCQSLVIVYKSSCLIQVGVMSESATVQGEAVSVDAPKLVQGSLCQGIWSSGKQNYMANLAIYPGRFELSFLPQNTQVTEFEDLAKVIRLLRRLSVSKSVIGWGELLNLFHGSSSLKFLWKRPIFGSMLKRRFQNLLIHHSWLLILDLVKDNFISHIANKKMIDALVKLFQNSCAS